MASSLLTILVYGYIKEIIKPSTAIPLDIIHVISEFFSSLFGSNILTFTEEMKLTDLLSAPKIGCIKNNKFELLYRGSEHEFSVERFHELCDDHAPTLTIVETEFGNVFGGYTEGQWTLNGGYIRDEN